MREIGLDAEAVFTHRAIKVWRSITERENGMLDWLQADGTAIRLHVKRYRVGSAGGEAAAEAKGIQALIDAGIATVPLVGWGTLPDGRSFLITRDLGGYEAGDKLLSAGIDFARLRDATADLAARLHRARLHHRDLYLCHFFAKVDGEDVQVRLIDAARVRTLPKLFARRWIVKDLAQFWYSAMQAGVPEDRRRGWIERYAQQRGWTKWGALVRSVERKAGWIGRHDVKLKASQPDRNVSIPR